MMKILYGAVAAMAVGIGGFFGFQIYAEHRAANEVEAAFAQIRATGAKAGHGKVSFDLKSRTVTISDIVGESAAKPPVSVKIASIEASGFSLPDPMRFSADNIAHRRRNRREDAGRDTPERHLPGTESYVEGLFRPRQRPAAARVVVLR